MHVRSICGFVAIWVATPAWAGSGPWVIGKSNASLYLGVEGQRLNHLAQTIDGKREVIEVDEGLSTFGAKGIGTLGITDRMEIEGTIPWYRVVANRDDGGLCAALGAQRCATTQSVGVLSMRGKGLVLDEYFGAPVSLAVGAEARFGIFTAGTRDRITNVGEGTLDVGPFAALGRTGKLGNGYWAGYVGGGMRYRFPNTDDFPRAGKVPGPEYTAEAQVLLAPDTRFAIGPSAYFFERAEGLDFDQVDLTDFDWLSSLSVTNLRAGATAVIRGGDRVAFSASALGTLYARNNPTDVFTLTLGVQFDDHLGADE